ncbi:hypothetical protein HanRHA438_Chr15g0721951 [Helianthus annuus]|nr:hypothetical protein HanRHA438_Chr15g0721951 [Helianthus annuus]
MNLKQDNLHSGFEISKRFVFTAKIASCLFRCITLIVKFISIHTYLVMKDHDRVSFLSFSFS